MGNAVGMLKIDLSRCTQRGYDGFMIEREIAPRLRSLFEQYPIVTVTGPRQSGKTTLCRETFPGLSYANLENPDLREFAQTDPRAFLAQYGDGAVIDEIQRVPELLSYLQGIVDEHGGNSLFVLTGSEQFPLSDAVSQSLAGRTALLRLLPFSLAERRRIGGSAEIDEMIFSGFYPRILDHGLEPRQALGDYFETYVERDVRGLGGVRDLTSFGRFMRLCAGRVGQLVNLSSLGSEAGISHPTVREWLAILERSYIVFQLQPYHANIGKRLTKSPKLYLYDVGLASYLLGIENAQQVATHPLRGQLFENLVIAETIKHRFNQGRDSRDLSFFRNANGLECDLLYPTGSSSAAIEVKSGSTISSDSFSSLNRVAAQLSNLNHKAVVYGGDARQSRSDIDVLPLSDLVGALTKIEVEESVGAFIDEHRSPGPEPDAVATLDAVFQTQVRPAIEALRPACNPLGDALFQRFSEQSQVSSGTTGVQGQGILDPDRWDATKNDYIVDQAFQLSDERPVEIRHEFWFRGYVGRGTRDFDIKTVASWVLDAQKVSSDFSVDGISVTRLKDEVNYTEVESRRPDSDRLVAEVTRSLMDRIRTLSKRA